VDGVCVAVTWHEQQDQRVFWRLITSKQQLLIM
jgi:hypothetical protein